VYKCFILSLSYGKIEPYDVRSQLWVDFETVMNAQKPYTTKWTDNLQETRTVFAAMLDLHKRMLAMEKRLDESGGDGK
jgi:hypothetical protein